MANLKDYLRNFRLNRMHRFLLAILLLLAYLFFVMYKFGAGSGLLIAGLTWSFFVLCTPIADAGIILDFPMRLILKVRMIYSEVGVWVIAISLNLYNFFVMPQIYQKTFILHLFYHILSNPFPYWIIIVLSAFGTYFSLYVGDTLFDLTTEGVDDKIRKQRLKWKIVFFVFLIIFVFILYDFLLNQMGVPLF